MRRGLILLRTAVVLAACTSPHQAGPNAGSEVSVDVALISEAWVARIFRRMKAMQ